MSGVPLFFGCLCLCLVTAGGCASGNPPAADPVAVLLDRDADLAPRRRALRQVAQQPIDSPTLAALHRVAWSDAQPTELRVGCMDRLIKEDAQDFWAVAARRVVTINRLDVLTELCGRAADQQRVEMTGPLIRSWSRPSALPDADRPEPAALLKLHAAQDPAAILWPVLLDPAVAQTLAEQTAAWVLLVRLMGGQAAEADLHQRAAEVGPASLGNDLLRCAATIGSMPHDREAVLWLTTLMRRDDGRAWQRLAADPPDAIARGPVALRHLPAWAAADAQLRQTGHAAMLARLDRRLSGRPLHPRGRDAETGMYVPPLDERWADHRDAIAPGDALVLWLVLDALDDPAVAAALFEQADADLSDTTSEHGGALVWDGHGRVIARRFASTLPSNDQRFISSHALIEAMYQGLAHYHFHAQRHDNAAYAGPGVGDLRFAERMGFACLVFTFIDANTLAADFYLPDGIVIDIGVIRRDTAWGR